MLTALGLTACVENQISSSGNLSFFQGDTYMKPGDVVRVYRSKSTGWEFVTELIPEGGGTLTIPKNVLKTDTENRTKPDVAVPLDLFLKIYTSELITRDFYFETPILGATVMPSNVTTALSWILRWSFSGQVISLSKNDFDQLVREVEIKCTSCRKKTSSETVQFILADTELLAGILKRVRAANQSLVVNTLAYQPPLSEYVYASTMISSEDKARVEVSEDKDFSLKLIYLDPMSSTIPIQPNSWIREFGFFTQTHPTAEFEYRTSFTDAGAHILRPQYSDRSVGYTLEMTVNNKNRLPLCNPGEGPEWQINRINRLSLSTLCQDPDPEDGLLLYSVVSSPPGMTLSSDGAIAWMPSQLHLTQKTDWILKFGVTDPQMGYSEYSVSVHLTPDRLPAFNFVGPGVALIEGAEGVFGMTAVDPDGDPLVIRAQAVSSLNVGLPAGSGNINSFLRTGTDGNYNWTWAFTPSFLQTVGSDGVMQIKFIISYDPANADLDTTLPLFEQVIEFTVGNTDDPPVWQTGVGDFSATEGVTTVILTSAFASDPNPNSTAVSYSLASPNAIDCSWDASRFTLQVVGGVIEITVNPEYKSLRECIFQLQATDAVGLSSESAPFSIEIADTNQAVITLPTAPTVLNGFERQRLDLQIQDMFEDLDYTQQDISETFIWQCSYDTVAGHLADRDCFTNGSVFRPSLGRDDLIGNWLPTSFDAGTYYVRLTVTDKGGASATHDFTVVVDQAPSPKDLEILYNGTTVNTGQTITDEDSTAVLTLKVTAPTADSIDQYDYVVMPGLCSVVGAGGACPAALLTPNGGFSGNGDLSFDMALTPSYTDGDSDFPGTFKQYSYTFAVYKQDQPSLRSEITVLVQVNNTNRAPTSLKASGCTNCTLVDSDESPLVVTINAAADTKYGPNWQRTYGTTFTVIDPDTNDLPAIEWGISSAQHGTLNSFAWSFKIPSCVNPSATGTVVRTLTMRGIDSRGGAIDRAINLTIQKATASSSCLQ